MEEIKIQGAEQLAQLAKRLREVGDKELQREMARAVNSAVKPIKQAAQQSALDTLPRRGGLAAEVAKSKFRTTRRSGTSRAGVRVTAVSNLSTWHLDQGIIRHKHKVQRTQQGWFTRPVEELAPEMRKELLASLDMIVAKLEGRHA